MFDMVSRHIAPTRLFLLLFVTFFTSATSANADSFRVWPDQVNLSGNFEHVQLLAIETDANGKRTDNSKDFTRRAKFVSSDPQVVKPTATGRFLATGNGKATIHVTVGQKTVDVPVVVTGWKPHPTIDYLGTVQPILNKAGCNKGGCHASQYGKGGFKLSVFSFQPPEDHKAIVRDRQQRRVNFLQPENSLFLQKPTLQVPHGGGKKLNQDSLEVQILANWIRNGAPGPSKASPQVTGISIFPKHFVKQNGDTQQVRVEATYKDGSTRDVTAWAKFSTPDESVLDVSKDGQVTVVGKGQAALMAYFEGFSVISTFVVPYADRIEIADWKSQNFIDDLALNKFKELGIAPSALCDDATFLRRVFIDLIGTLPTPEVTTAFLESKAADKRSRIVDGLLGLTGNSERDIYNDAYASYWTLKWSDLIRNQSKKVGEQGMWALHNWIRESLRVNKPLDKFATELITGKGSIYLNGPANYFRINANADELTESTAQIFLGIRLQCAKCHHHPFEKYSQDDYKQFSKFFSQVTTKVGEDFGLFGIGRERVVYVRSEKTVNARPLGAEPVTHALDVRIPLAEWLTSPDNDYFARNAVNRYVAYLFGRGLVNPVDDLRETNPPTNVALMEGLAKYFAESEYNVKQLLRLLTTSRLYQLSSQPTEQNASDHRFYSHYQVKRLAAEPLLDAIDQVTNVQTKFRSLPLGARAIDLPDIEYPNYFLRTFAKPVRASVCECERSPDENLSQALHTLNGETISGKISNKNGRIAKMIADKKSEKEIVTELYLTTLCRMPNANELSVANEIIKESPSPKVGYEDLTWALLNSKQFLFNH